MRLSPPIIFFIFMIGGFRHHCWCASTSSSSVCFCHHRLIFRCCWAPTSSLLADLTVADWFLRLHGYATSLPLIGVTVFYYHWHLPLLLMSNFVFMLVISSPCRLRQLLPIDNFDYDRRTSYMLRGSSTQAWGLYLQFGLVPDTFHMDS